MVKLGDILTYLDERVELEDFTEYITITVKRRHGGLEEREWLFGHQIKTKKQFRLIPGSFIISRVQCWHQAFAIVPDDLPSTIIASTNYDQFAISPEVDPRYFWWFSHSPYFTETVRSSAVGVVIEKMVFKRDEWLKKEIPLPPLAEQQRIVAKIEQLAAKVEEAQTLRHRAKQEIDALAHSSLRQTFTKHPGWQNVALETVCTTIIDCLHSNPIYSDEGIPTVRSPDIGWGKIDLRDARKTSETEYKRRTRRGELQVGDLVLVREGGGTGKAGIVEPDQKFSLGQRVMMLRPNKELVLSKFLLYQWLSPLIFQDQIIERMKGSASPHLNIRALKKFNFLLPPLDEQRRIVTYLDYLQAKIDSQKYLQAQTQTEFDALLPSILDKAFKGEL